MAIRNGNLLFKKLRISLRVLFYKLIKNYVETPPIPPTLPTPTEIGKIINAKI